MPTVFGSAEVLITEYGGLQMVSLGHKEQGQTLSTLCLPSFMPTVFGSAEVIAMVVGGLQMASLVHKEQEQTLVTLWTT